MIAEIVVWLNAEAAVRISPAFSFSRSFTAKMPGKILTAKTMIPCSFARLMMLGVTYVLPDQLNPVHTSVCRIRTILGDD
jgi:hypothetical protein